MIRPLVWVLPPVAGAYPFAFSGWVYEPRLLVESTEVTAGAQGAARFQVVRKERIDGAGLQLIPDAFHVGQYVAITLAEAAAGVPDWSTCVWIGTITSYDATPITSSVVVGAGGKTDDDIGIATAVELGETLDKIRLAAFFQDDNSGYPSLVAGNPPAANVRGKGLLGNAVQGTDGNGHDMYLFDRSGSVYDDPSADGAHYWTPWRLLTHALALNGVLSITAETEDQPATGELTYAYTGHAAGSLAAWCDDPTTADSYALDGLTLRGLLDLLAGDSVGLLWRVGVRVLSGGPALVLTICSRSQLGAAYGPPKTASVSRSLLASELVDLALTITPPQYDRIEIIGARHVFGLSLSKRDGNLDKLWTTGEAMDYQASMPSERSQQKYTRVYAQYTLTGSDRSGRPSQNDQDLPLLPAVTWDGSAVTISQVSNGDMYLPDARFTRFLPYSVTDPDGTARQQKPMVLYRENTSGLCYDLVNDVETPQHTPIGGGVTPAVDVDDARPVLTVRYPRQHWLSGGAYTPIPEDGDAEQLMSYYDWVDMVCTVGIQASQSLCVTRTRHNGAIRDTLTVLDPSLQFSAMLKGAAIGINSDNSALDTLPADLIHQNDYPQAQRWCDELAAWAFSEQTACVAVVALSYAPYLLRSVGDTVTDVAVRDQVTDRDGSRQTNSVIVSLATDWPTQRCTITTATGARPELRRTGGAASSPVSGGRVSGELAGTPAQAIQQLQARTDALTSAVGQLPLIPHNAGGGAAAEPRVVFVAIAGGNEIPGATVDGVAARIDTITASELPVPSSGSGPVAAWPIPDDLPQGIGVAVPIGADPTHAVFVINDAASVIASDLLRGQMVTLGTSTTFTVGDADEFSYTCYYMVSGPW